MFISKLKIGEGEMTLFNLLETGTIVITSITSIGLALILYCGDDNSPAESQIPVFIVWETIFGGVGDEFAYSMVTTNDGGAMPGSAALLLSVAAAKMFIW